MNKLFKYGIGIFFILVIVDYVVSEYSADLFTSKKLT